MSDYLYLIPLLPFIGFLINGLLIGRLPKPVISLIACGSVGLSLLLSLMLFFELKAMPADGRIIEQVLFSWIPAGSFNVNIAYMLDPLSAVMILVVTGVGFLIHVYSVGYMSHDPGYGRFLASQHPFDIRTPHLAHHAPGALLFSCRVVSIGGGWRLRH